MTRFGWTITGGAVVLAVVAWLLDWVPAAVVAVGALAVVAVALVYLLRPIRLGVTREVQPQRVGRTDEALALYEITNLSPLPTPPVVANQTFGELEVRVVLPRLRPRQRAIRTLRLPTERRGVFSVGPLQSIRADPFGIVRRTWRYAGSDELWVYPRILPFKPVPTGLVRPLEGPTSDTAPQGGVTFHRLREYEVGDDLRLIHWKSTARTGTLMVRHNIDTSQPFSVVLVDVRPGVYTSSLFELALDAAASAVVASATGRSPIQLRTTGGERIGGPSNRAVDPLLDTLTTLDPSPEGSLADELVLLRSDRGGTSLTVITGSVGEEELAGVARLRRRFQRIVVLQVVDEVDSGGGAGGQARGLSVLRVSTGEQVVAAWNRAVGW